MPSTLSPAQKRTIEALIAFQLGNAGSALVEHEVIENAGVDPGGFAVELAYYTAIPWTERAYHATVEPRYFWFEKTGSETVHAEETRRPEIPR